MAPLIQFPGPWSALVTLPVPPDREAVYRVLRLEERVLERDAELQTIPAFNRLLVTGSPKDWEPDAMQRALEEMAAAVLIETVSALVGAPEVILPACYDPELALDLQSLTTHTGLDASEIAELHASKAYTVLATGFAPGFAYLGDVDPQLAAPRLDSPRREVPAGSIGIADRRTGVYPSAGPGGWRIVGRVPESLFQDATARLTRFSPGQHVRFRAVSLNDFRAES